MWLTLALAAAVSFAVAGFLFKIHSLRGGSPASFFPPLYTLGALTFLLRMEAPVQIGLPCPFAGAIIGTALAIGNALFMAALRSGPLSLTSPLINFNVVFLVIGSVVFFGERPSPAHLLLVTLLVAAILILPIDPREKLTIQDRRWYGLVLAASLGFAIRNGGLKWTQEMGLNNNEVLFFAYLFPAFWFWCRKFQRRTPLRPALTTGVPAGLCSGAGMILYAEALARGPATLVIPVFSTYNMFVVLLSWCFLRERLTPVQWISVALILSSVLLLR